MRLFGLGEPDFDHPPALTPAPSPESPKRPPKPTRAVPQTEIDPILRHLVQKSGLEIDLAELDMQRWVQGVEPFRPWSEDSSS